MNSTLLSIIIPLYNKETYIRHCIEELLFIKSFDYEILCVDDHSTDSSYSILQDLAKSNSKIRCYKNNINMGVANTRNRVLSLAHGKYVCFVDADDTMDASALNHYLHSMESTQADGCFIRILDTKENDLSIRHEFSAPISGKKILDYFVRSDTNFLYACGALWNRSFLNTHNIRFHDMKIGEDGLFILEALLHSNRVITNLVPGYHYNINSSSTVYSKNSMKYSAFGQLKQILFLLFQLNSQREEPEIITFIKWYLRKHIGGIKNLTLEDFSLFPEGLNSNELFLYELLIQGADGFAKSLSLSKENELLLKTAGSVYLYGAGYEVLNTIYFCNQRNIEIKGILVSDKANNPDTLYGYRIHTFDPTNIKDPTIPFLIIAHSKHLSVIEKTLSMAGIKHILKFEDNK